MLEKVERLGEFFMLVLVPVFILGAGIVLVLFIGFAVYEAKLGGLESMYEITVRTKVEDGFDDDFLCFAIKPTKHRDNSVKIYCEDGFVTMSTSEEVIVISAAVVMAKEEKENDDK